MCVCVCVCVCACVRVCVRVCVCVRFHTEFYPGENLWEGGHVCSNCNLTHLLEVAIEGPQPSRVEFAKIEAVFKEKSGRINL